MKITTALLIIAASAPLCASAGAAVLAGWTFESSRPAGPGPYAPEFGLVSPSLGSGRVVHAHPAAAYSSPLGNGSAHSFSSDHWSVGDYYEFTTSTIGYQSITLYWDQASSNGGPRDFSVQYSADGVTFFPAWPYQVQADSPPLPPWNPVTASGLYSHELSGSVALLENKSKAYFRLFLESSTSTSGGTFTDLGETRVDNVMIIAWGVIPSPGGVGLALVGLASTTATRRWREGAM